MRKEKGILTLIAAILIISIIPLSSVSAAEILDGGTYSIERYGNEPMDITYLGSFDWSIDSDYTLTVSGTGAAGELCLSSQGDYPWYNHQNDIKKIVISEGAVKLGDEFICIMPNVTDVYLPSSLKEIDDYVFLDVGKLQNVYFAGSEAQWKSINISHFGNDSLSSAKIYFGVNDISGDVVQTPAAPEIASQNIAVALNGLPISFDQPPVMQNDRVLVPIRAIFEAMGYAVDWNEAAQTATAVKNGDSIIVQLNNAVIDYTTDGATGAYQCDVPPQLISDRILVPVRAIAESAGCTVDWDEAAQTVIIQK